MKKNFYQIGKQGLNVLIITSFLSSVGGLSLEVVKENVILLAPLLVALPALNDMTGDFGSIISSRYTTLKYLGDKNEDKKLKKLYSSVLVVAILMSTYVSFLTNLIHYFKTGLVDTVLPVSLIVLLTNISILSILVLITNKLGDYYFKKGLDPDNYLIPVTTSVADLGSMTLMAFLIITFS